MLNLTAAVSQWEREAIGERTRDALSHKRRQGERVGNIAFGFRLAGDGQHLEPDPAEQEALAEIRRLRHEGATLRGIAATLNHRAYRTRRGNTLAAGVGSRGYSSRARSPGETRSFIQGVLSGTLRTPGAVNPKKTASLRPDLYQTCTFSVPFGPFFGKKRALPTLARAEEQARAENARVDVRRRGRQGPSRAIPRQFARQRH